MLWEHEGKRAVRWPLAAAGLLFAVWAIPFAGGVASFYLVKSGGSFPLVALSVAVTLGLGRISTLWSNRRPWHAVLANGLLGTRSKPTRMRTRAVALLSQTGSAQCAPFVAQGFRREPHAPRDRQTLPDLTAEWRSTDPATAPSLV
jgi:hypothetical protein